jgi:hypothetical protein
MAEKIVALDPLAPGILFLFLIVFVSSCVSGSIRLRIALMILLSVAKVILWLVVFIKSMIVIMMTLQLMWLI